MVFSEEYELKRKKPEEIVKMIQNGWVCCTDIAAAIPPAIMEALNHAMSNNLLSDIKLHTILDLTQIPDLDMRGNSVGISWFSGIRARNAVNRGTFDVMPCYYRDMPSLFETYIEVDAFFATVSPMDNHGFFSTGATASNSESLIKKAKRIFLEVNPNMPRAMHGPTVHISQVTALCENNVTLPILKPAELDSVSQTIGAFIADEVPNGATIQLGIGSIPEAVGLALKGKYNLGIHTELFTDSMVELIECGVVTNTLKPIHRGKTVATMSFGSQRIYDFINNNPSVEMLPVDYVNDPKTIAMHPNFISVNGALEVDFWGQVCAESIGTKHISGTGGQADYVRGAIESKGGKSFIAFPSTAHGGAISRIRSTLTPGAVVTTSKNDVDYIVTEYGIAKLRGKTLSERTKALISIAHPKFREELKAQAKARNILI